MTLFAPLLEVFFTERLIGQRRASPHTVASYRDTFSLLLVFAQQRTGRPPSRLKLEDLDAPLIGAFLEHLEQERGNSIRTRNARLAAVHSLFRFAALRHPEHAGLTARVLAIPPKRADKPLVTFLTKPEIDALLAAPDRSLWIGRRDHALLVTAIQTGLRVSELVGVRCQDVSLGRGPHLRCEGKGRKERVTPLTSQTVAVLRACTTRRPCRAAVPRQAPRRPAQPRRCAHQVRPERAARLSEPEKQTPLAAHAATHQRDAAPARRSRQDRDRPVAGA